MVFPFSDGVNPDRPDDIGLRGPVPKPRLIVQQDFVCFVTFCLKSFRSWKVGLFRAGFRYLRPTLRLTAGAAAQLRLPGCVAVMVVYPRPFNLMMLPEKICAILVLALR